MGLAYSGWATSAGVLGALTRFHHQARLFTDSPQAQGPVVSLLCWGQEWTHSRWSPQTALQLCTLSPHTAQSPALSRVQWRQVDSPRHSQSPITHATGLSSHQAELCASHRIPCTPQQRIQSLCPHMTSLLPCVWGQDGSLSSLSSVDSDGAGRSGTYILIDLVLNRMVRGEALPAALPGAGMQLPGAG